jgi:ketosteroid isomerase-like protein
MTDQHQEIVRRCNDAWQQRNWEVLSDCYHPDAILLPPDAGEPISGRDDIIATYQEFMAAATIGEFRITDLTSYDFTHTHLVHMRFELEYQLDSQTLKDIGLEVYVLESDATPRIVWRSQSITDQLMLAQ